MSKYSGRARPNRSTLNDVALLASVDRSVVSRVVNDDPKLNVRPETRQRVRDAIDELGYRPNAAARSLRTSRTYMYGLLIPDFANPVYAEIIKGAENAARGLGYGLMTTTACDVRRGPDNYLDLFGQGRVDGLLLAGEDADGAHDHLNPAPVPWLLVNRAVPNSRRYVVLDDERGGRLAVEHLLELGHRRIAHIAGPEITDTGQRRYAGYLGALRDAGLSADPGLMVRADYTPAGGASALRGLLTAPDPPTAVFVANVASAVGALHTARTMGVSVPRELSVITVHDMPLAAYLAPALTTVRMPLEELGRRAVQRLSSAAGDDPITEIVTGPIDLVRRESTAAPAPGR
ncbi:MAG TPA: LacI family DNA-binding transcriptional regulator [Pseudonocardia sp.]|jgi:LacI family transcriptional regulator|nr:LacI family DNA-binding transcriptional regulator [Pseudonocardia sp.]